MKAIELISVPVTDQDRAKKFYVAQLGFQVIVEAPFGNNQQWIQLGLPGSSVSITLVTWFEKMPAGSLQGVLIDTDDIEKDVELLKAKGVNIAPVDNTPWGKFANFSDPDGNGWSLHQK